MKILIEKIEEVTGKKIKENFISIGLDIATRCGICQVQVKSKYVHFEWFYVNFTSNTRTQKYKQIVQVFEDIINKDQNIVVIEDTYLKYFGRIPQVQVLKQLTRYGAFGISEAVRKNIKYEIIGAKQSRAEIGVNTAGYGKGNSKKAVADWLKTNLNIDLQGDDDVSDAIVLALLGILEGVSFKTKRKPRKKKK